MVPPRRQVRASLILITHQINSCDSSYVPEKKQNTLFKSLSICTHSVRSQFGVGDVESR